MGTEGRGTHMGNVSKNHAAHGMAETGRTRGSGKGGGEGRRGSEVALKLTTERRNF